ncbi:9606_t:CDS:2 [Diversispora eburnea]|uniref:Palmitoyltransferase n=1 Tax=Diversispora eburnea TaxID=1213867 RepID=A0A9N8W3U3_9GLOM|nr:9606_t:CDS:2 [Diversispora eburnea]
MAISVNNDNFDLACGKVHAYRGIVSNPFVLFSRYTLNFNPISNPNNSSNVGALDALLPMEVASIKNQPTANTTTTINVASSSNNATAIIQQNGTSTDIRIPMSSTFICKRDGRLRWCERCNYVKPDRCHHCSECDKCVLKMDQ